MIRLTWIFDNNHQWHRDFNSIDEAHSAAYDFGLFTHPNVVHVHIKDLETDSPTGVINLIDCRELLKV